MHFVVHTEYPLAVQYQRQGEAWIDARIKASWNRFPPGYYTASDVSEGESCDLALLLAGMGCDGWCASGNLEDDEILAIGHSDLKRHVMHPPYLLAAPTGLEVVLL